MYNKIENQEGQETKEKKPPGWWNDYQHCYDEAKKYSTRYEFERGCCAAYKNALRNKWLDDYIWFEKSFRWTFDECYKEALKFSSVKNFRKDSHAAYTACIKYKWIDEFDWLERTKQNNGYWGKERCYEEAKNYKSRGDFAKGSPSAYNKARKNHWLDGYSWFFESASEKKWDYETCMEESKKYKTRTDFHNGNNSAYAVARRNKWLDEYTWLESTKNLEKQDVIYVYEFKEFNIAYVGRTLEYRKKDRDWEHLYDRKDSVAKFVHENNIKMPEPIYLEEGITVKEGSAREQFWIDKYKNEGWTLLNKKKGGSIGGLGRGKWCYESCYEEAKKYTRIVDFAKGSPGAYQKAIKEKWRDDYTWLPYAKRWTYEEIYELAKQFDYKVDFYRGNCGAYDTALRNGWLDDFDWFIDGIKRTGENHRKWNYNTCKEEAKKYKTRGEFGKSSSRAYYVALQNGWLSEYTWLKRRSSKNLSTEGVPTPEE